MVHETPGLTQHSLLELDTAHHNEPKPASAIDTLRVITRVQYLP